jgi:hypothetical protein
MKMKRFNRSRKALLATATCAAFSLPLMAGEKTKPAKEVSAPAEESRVHFLFKTEFASGYTTPRGMIVRDTGLTIQPLFLTFVDIYKGDGFLSSVKMVGGVWNDFGTTQVSKNAPYGSNPKTNWTEIDPIFGFSFGLAEKVTLDVTYIGFAEQILDIGTVHNLEVKLSYNDSGLLGDFSLNPYVLFWQELKNKTTSAAVPQAVLGPSPFSGANPQPGSSFYFEAGLTPTYTFKNLGNLKVEAPIRFLLPDSRFYGEYYGEASTLGLFEAGLRVSAPITFMPKGYGNWGAYAGFKYQYYNDENLYNLNSWNAPGEPTRDNWVVYGGVSVFF